MGATLVPEGATFRTWAPDAVAVHVLSGLSGWEADENNKLTRGPEGHWFGFWPGFKDGTEYKFWTVGEGGAGWKRDPYARELSWSPEFPHSNCVARDPGRFPWRSDSFRPPPFHEMIIYQLHIGSFFSPSGGSQQGTFLDVITKVPYLENLGINTVQFLPVQEHPTQFSMGYNGLDYFSPENSFALRDEEIPSRLPSLNSLLQARGVEGYTVADLSGPANQLRALVDVLHIYGIAVIFDVVYNHAGGEWGDESLYFFDRQTPGDNSRSQYFSTREYVGGLCFDFSREPVRQFLIDNAKFLFEEYRINGLRHDDVKEILLADPENGVKFCQHLNSTCKFLRPEALQHAELWKFEPKATRPVWEGGLGYDTRYEAGLRDRLRDSLAEAAAGEFSPVRIDSLHEELRPWNSERKWQGVQNLETHDEVYNRSDRKPRIAKLADGSNARSWYARSRTRTATGLLLTSPGIPMLFMGQEFLEDKPWDDNLVLYPELRLYWSGLEEQDPSMRDHLRFTRELIQLRRRLPALTAEGFNPFYTHNDDRVLAFHRWVPQYGRDVVVIASFRESILENYRFGFPLPGIWNEVFNSDIYDHWVNPWGRGNNGEIHVDGPPWQGLDHSAPVVLPANSILVFEKRQ